MTNEYFIDKVSGEAYTSQREAERLLGIPRSTIQRWLDKNRATTNTNENNQLDTKTLKKLAFMGHSKGYEKCSEFIELISEAGIKAFIYHQAGYELEAKHRYELPDFTNPAQAAMAWAKEYEAKQLVLETLNKAEQKIEEDAPKVEIYDDFIELDESQLIGTIAKVLKIPPRTFFKKLRDDGFLNKDNAPSQKALRAKLMTTKLHCYYTNGRIQENITPLITNKGLIYYSRKYKVLECLK
jgi:phage antirepressor YoqD-like protein